MRTLAALTCYTNICQIRDPEFSFEGYTPSQVGYHAYLLVDACLAKGVDVTTHGSQAPAALITSLTWAGYEFAEAARDDTRWKKATGERPVRQRSSASGRCVFCPM